MLSASMPVLVGEVDGGAQHPLAAQPDAWLCNDIGRCGHLRLLVPPVTYSVSIQRTSRGLLSRVLGARWATRR